MKDDYKIVKNAISKDLTKFIYSYFLLKRDVAAKVLEEQYIPPRDQLAGELAFNWLGTWQDGQVPNTYSLYGDLVMETLLQKLKSKVEKQTGIKLFETYSFARVYERGAILPAHTDRYSCEISTTLNLGGDKIWPIYLTSENETIEVNLEPGDMMIYKGTQVPHWRDEFDGETSLQVFLHYNDTSGKNAELNKFDKRELLGLPQSFQDMSIKFNNDGTYLEE